MQNGGRWTDGVLAPPSPHPLDPPLDIKISNDYKSGKLYKQRWLKIGVNVISEPRIGCRRIF